MVPDILSGFSESVFSGKFRVVISQSHYWESRFRQDTYMCRSNKNNSYVKHTLFKGK